MPQSLLIFRKDLRHLWPETLVTLLLFAAFAWSAPSGWNASPYAGVIMLLAILIKILMPVAWLVLISRLVHDESLVGDRQFWTSRPYHWAKLLAAKLLYLVAFLYLPFLLMQVYLLKHAGLYPTTAIPALLHNLLLLTVIIVVPLTAIAAVTGTFARMLISTIGAILYLVVLLLLLAWFLWQRLEPTTLEPFLYVILIALPAAVLVYQYATRKTATSRILLLATPLIAFLILLATPAGALIRHAYPIASGSDIPKLSPLPEELLPKEAPKARLQIFQNKVNVGFPFTIENIGKDFDYTLDGVAVTIDAPNVHWQSPYVAGTGQEFNAGSQPVQIAAVPMPLSVFNQLHATPVTVHLSLATSKLKADAPADWKATLQPFSVPGHGVCAYSSEDPNLPPICRYPFKAPELNYVTAPVSPGPCPAIPGTTQPGRASLSARPSGIDFDPVVTVPLRLSTGSNDPRAQSTLCPGTNLTFIEAKPQGKYRLEIDEKNVVLDLFVQRIREQPATPPQLVPQGPGE